MPAVEGSTSTSNATALVEAVSPAILQDAKLRIDVSSLTGRPESVAEESLFRYRLLPVAGKPPQDIPFWINLASMPLARGLAPHTIRYKSGKRLPRNVDDIVDAVRDKVWRRIDELLPDAVASGTLPRITFDESPLSGDGRKGVLDLVFVSKDTFGSDYHSVVYGLDQIHIAGVAEGGTTDIYSYACSTNSLDGSIMPFECIRLPIESLDAEAVLAAFNVVFASLGSVLGLAKVTITSERWNAQQQFNGVVRGYVQLAPSSMVAPWTQAASKLPTHWVCNGVPYTLRYRDVELHKTKVFSRNFVIPVKQFDGGPNAKIGASALAIRSTLRARMAR